jgi:uncharacterized membrane protein YfcA
MSATELALAGMLACAAAFSQSLSGFGFNLLIVPPLALVIGAKEAVVAATLMGLITSTLTLLTARAAVAWRLGGILFATAAIGMPVGLAILILVNPDALRVLIALTVLAAALLYWRGYRVAAQHPMLDAAAGFVSGVLNTSTSMSGPPLVLYLQNRGVGREEFRGTINAFFLASGLLAASLFAAGGQVDGHELSVLAVSAPLILLGWAAGHQAFRRLDVVRFQQIVVAVLLVSATMAIAGVVGHRTLS